jgi:CheY-like chemotaxis protein
LRILVVEDNKTIASFLVEGLRQAGFVVEQSRNGRDGLDVDESCDVAIVDVMLPGLDGISLIEEPRLAPRDGGIVAEGGPASQGARRRAHGREEETRPWNDSSTWWSSGPG